MRYFLITVAALALPGAAFAGTDCGDNIVQTAEAAIVIQTPEQFAAPVVAVNLPTPAPQAAPVFTTNTVPPVQQAAPVIAAPAPAPAVVQVAEAQSSATFSGGSAQAAPVAAYSALLKNRITRGAGGLNLFDYAGAHAGGDLTAITNYTDYLASKNPDAMNEADQIAYWANLYNALTLKVVLENYPVSSIRKIKKGFKPGPWDFDAVRVNGKTLSLNDIEHGILRKNYPNPAMVHYMVNCASIGCPNLGDKIWVGATLDADREQAARDFINSPRGVKIDGKDLKVSSIYNWFKEDFGGSKSAALGHFRKFAGADLRAALDAGAKIDGYKYNWDLNE